MSFVAVYIGIWMINCDIYSFDWKCKQYNNSVFTILMGVREDLCTWKIFAIIIDYNIFYMTVYIFSFINIILM